VKEKSFLPSDLDGRLVLPDDRDGGSRVGGNDLATTTPVPVRRSSPASALAPHEQVLAKWRR